MEIFKKLEVEENVSVLREIREKISKETQDMTYEEFKEYLNNQNTEDGYALSEKVLSKEWLTEIEEEAWKDL